MSERPLAVAGGPWVSNSSADRPMPRDKVLIIEDEIAIREVIRQFLEARGYEVMETGTCAGAERLWRAGPDIAVLDYSLPDGNALQLLPRLKSLDSSIPVIILTGHGSIDLAVEAIKLGAEQFLTKPTELATLALVIQRGLENQRNRLKQLADKSQMRRA